MSITPAHPVIVQDSAATPVKVDVSFNNVTDGVALHAQNVASGEAPLRVGDPIAATPVTPAFASTSTKADPVTQPTVQSNTSDPVTQPTPTTLDELL